MTPEQERRREVAALQWMVKARDCLDEAADNSGTVAEVVAANALKSLSTSIDAIVDFWNNSGDTNCRAITMEEIEGR